MSLRVTDFSLLSMDMAQIFLQRRSSPLVDCCMESHPVSVEQASQSCSRTSHRFKTDATPVLCFSMSLCTSCKPLRIICNKFQGTNGHVHSLQTASFCSSEEKQVLLCQNTSYRFPPVVQCHSFSHS